jgi:hypothetical protein
VSYRSEPNRRSSNAGGFQFVARQLLRTGACSDAIALEGSVQEFLPVFREHLAVRFGPVGYAVLFEQARQLTAAAHPTFSTIEARPDGTLDRLNDLFSELAFDSALDGAVDLLANLLTTIADFVGYELTNQLVSRRWPEVRLQEDDEVWVA